VAIICCSISLCATAPGTPNPEVVSAAPSHTVQGFLMVTSVMVNGQGPYAFLIDTGTNTTVIDPELAAELQMKPVDRMSIRTVAESRPAVRYFADTVTTGAASVAHLEVLGAPLPELQKLDRSIRGVLGMNFLLLFSFRFDYEHKRFQIYPPGDPLPLPDGLHLKAEIHDARILVPVSSVAAVNGRWRLGLDSGIAQTLIFADRIDASRTTCGGPDCLMRVSSNVSSREAIAVHLPQISIGRVEFNDFPAVVLPGDTTRRADPQDGLLPAAMFRSVSFDRATATITIKPR
jgi:predicted aspartyl protease